MKKTFTIVCLLMLAVGHRVAAQSIQTKTINAAGNSATSGNIMLEWSMGEMTAVLTLSSGNLLLTQGLLQPYPGQLQSPLPVTWLYLKARLVNGQSELEWKVAQEINNDHFEVERSADGNQFVFLKTVNSLGNTSGPRTYTALDPSPFAGISFYRIKQVDIDAQFTYSAVANVRKDQLKQFSLYPNPANESLYLNMPVLNASSFLHIFDASGKLVHSETVAVGRTNATINIAKLLPGMYILKIQHGAQSWNAPFIKR